MLNTKDRHFVSLMQLREAETPLRGSVYVSMCGERSHI